jgi:hypothetical protein
MRLWREGDRSVGICERCEKRVTTRFERRTFPMRRPRVDVPDVLVSVCDDCGAIVAVPHQSTPKIAESRRRTLEKIEVRIPLELHDLLGLLAHKFSTRVEALSAPLLRFYLGEVGRDTKMAALACRLSHEPLALGPNKGRISLALEKGLWDAAWERAQQAGIKERSEVVRGIILAAALDAGLDRPRTGARPSARRRTAIETIATAV